jgi:hypothetical protein
LFPFLVAAAPEKIAAMQTEEFFLVRRNRADREAFRPKVEKRLAATTNGWIATRHRPPLICRLANLLLQAQLNPLFCNGIVLIRLPVAAKIAFVTAGKMGGSVGSPRPVGA